MPLYEYRCRACGYTDTSTVRGNDLGGCPNCSNVRKGAPSLLKRVWQANVALASTFTPHYNHAVGRYVSTMGEFKDALKAGSEEASRMQGHDVNYTPVMPGDIKPPTDEGLAETQKAKRDSGMIDSPSKTFV